MSLTIPWSEENVFQNIKMLQLIALGNLAFNISYAS